MTEMFPILLDLLFPRRSLTGGEGEFITESELRSLRSAPVILETPQLRLQQLEWIDRIVAAADYDAVPLLKKAVRTLKYTKVRSVAATLGMILADAAGLLADDDQCVLCPVPLHWIRRFSRGFNQAELLALAVGRECGWEVRSLLRRVRWTGSQVGRHRGERLIGVNDAFLIRSGIAVPEHIILIDDLSTTGATLDACAKALKNAGVKTVEGLVLAMG